MKNKKFAEAVELIKSRIYIELRTRFEIEEVEAIFKTIDNAVASIDFSDRFNLTDNKKIK